MSLISVLRRFPSRNLATGTSKILLTESRDRSIRCATAIQRCYSKPVSHEDVRNLTKAEWEERLTPEQFSVCREQCTEAPFSGMYNGHFEKGIYKCVGCETEVFTSEAKYDSGTGWPSFTSAYVLPNGLANTIERPENSLDQSTFRTEVICRKCDSHLGHVFDDGPEPTGKRYCINSIALKFIPAPK